MPSKFIPVLFSSANHLTEAHVLLLAEAARKILEEVPHAEISKCIISPVNDYYINKCKTYKPVKINGVSCARSRFNGAERLEMARATVNDFRQYYSNELPLIEVDSYEIEHTSDPVLKQKRGYIEHYERLMHLQREELHRASQEGDKPALYVLIGGADLANGMGNWSWLKGMPFLIATRETPENPKGLLNTNNNFVDPSAYLQVLNCSADLFSGFHSGTFTCDASDPRASLSSTQLAECKPEAIRLMGDNAFATLVSILINRLNTPEFDADQKNTAEKTLACLQQLKFSLSEGKQTVLSQIAFESIDDLKIGHHSNIILMDEKFPAVGEKIRLSDYIKTKSLSTGKTNEVSLWAHRQNPDLQIVVKKPRDEGVKNMIIHHNISSINHFFMENAAWEIEGENAFAMKYFQGEVLSEEEFDKLESSIVSVDGTAFTMLDPNIENYLKLPTGEIVPVDFDYMINHNAACLAPYQKKYLNDRVNYVQRVAEATKEEGIKYVLNSYPQAKDFLESIWIIPSQAPGKKDVPALLQFGIHAKAPQVSDDTVRKLLAHFILTETSGHSLGQWSVISESPVIEAGRSRSTGKQALASMDYQIDCDAGNQQITIWKKENGRAATEISNSKEQAQIINQFLTAVPEKKLTVIYLRTVFEKLVQLNQTGSLSDLASSLKINVSSLQARHWKVSKDRLFGNKWYLRSKDFEISFDIRKNDLLIRNLNSKIVDPQAASTKLKECFPEIKQILQNVPESQKPDFILA